MLFLQMPNIYKQKDELTEWQVLGNDKRKQITDGNQTLLAFSYIPDINKIKKQLIFIPATCNYMLYAQ